LLELLPTRIVQVHGDAAGEVRYLSFDDGPHPKHTLQLLDLLAEHNVRASFFLVGKRVEQYPGVVERIVAAGHLIGNHSWSHEHFGRRPLAEQLRELDRTDAVLAGFDGHLRHRIRPPQGSLPLSLLVSRARRRRSVAYWSYDSRDYRKPSVVELVAGFRHAPPAAGDIVLMHDDSALAHDALAVLLPEWREAGHAFRALPAEQHD
jgi:peptidoglycan/xylan/chitin deacetylase (PgdA/CDA1 family)